jgi:hypothetical protein
MHSSPNSFQNKLLFGILILGGILFSACEPSTPQKMAVPTFIPTAVIIIPSKTPDLGISPIPPTHFPKVLITPSPTEFLIEKNQIYADIPDWLKNENTDTVFMALTGREGDSYLVSVINAVTQEKYTLRVVNTQGFFWLDGGRSIGLLSGGSVVTKIDLQSGQETQLHPKGDFLRFHDYFSDREPEPLLAAGNLMGSDFYLGDAYELRVISFDRKYSVNTNNDNQIDFEQRPLYLETLGSENVVPITNPLDNFYQPDYVWSPNQRLLAMLQTRTLPSGPGYWPSEYLRIYDADKKAFIAKYNGKFSGIEWSSDGTQLLYTIEPFQGGFHSGLPCIFSLISGESKCFYTVQYEDKEDFKSMFRWLPDGSGITYLIDGQREGGYYGQFCIYRFKTDQVTCPTKTLSEIKGRAIPRYDISPDGRFVIFDYDEAGPRSDFIKAPYTSLVGLDGQGYLSLSSAKDYQNSQNPMEFIGRGVVWRPIHP